MLAVKRGISQKKSKSNEGNSGGDGVTDATSTSRSNIQSKASISEPTTIELRGINVHFPFKPYPCQKDYMEKVLDALHRSENALLESPTGTGKTLCLLCSTLAWQREQARLLPQKNGTDSFGNDDAAIASVAAAATSPDKASSTVNTPSTRKLPTIIYASRTHSQLTQVVNELKNTRYRPRHAVLGSREQLCVHPKVNPNNTGSPSNNNTTTTASEINHQCSKLIKDRKCKYRNNLDTFTASPQSQNDHENSGEFGMQPVMDMEELIVLGRKRQVCPFYFTRGHIADAEIIFIPYNYLFDKDARTQSLSDVQWQNSIIIFDEAHNLESFASESASFDLSGVDIGGCVNEVTRALGYLQSMSDFEDSGSGKSGGASYGGVKVDNLIRLKSIFLQFEHYLENELPAAGGSYTGEYIFEIFSKGANLTYSNHGIFLTFLKQIADMVMEMRGGGGVSSTGTPKLDHFVGCVKRIFGTATELQCLAKARAYRVHISPRSSGSGSSTNKTRNNDGGGFVTRGNNSNGPGRILSYWCFAPSLAMHELASLNVRSILVTSGTLSPLPSYSLELGLSFPHRLENPHIISKEQINVRVISKGVSGKVLSSTYERRDTKEYIIELGNTIISLARVIPGGILIFFPSYGVMENCVEQWGGPISSRSRFQSGNANRTGRNRNSFFEVRGRRSNSRSSSSDSKSRCCFPHAPNYYNHGAKGSHTTPWTRLLAIKSVVLEPKSTSELKIVIEEFNKYISMPKSSGCIFMGVCRGKISEGIDFADDKCRAVIMTGIPFAPYLDPKIKLKREYLDGIRSAVAMKPTGEGGFGATDDGHGSGKDSTIKSLSSSATLSGADWYSQQAHRAVNQAVGRVIRHRSDYGSILLLDSRFEEARNQIGLSKWVRPYIEKDSGIGAAIGSLVNFFRVAKEMADANKKTTTRSLGIDLQYEKDILPKNVGICVKEKMDVEEMNKIAFVKTTVQSSKDSGNIEMESSLLDDGQRKALLNVPDVETSKEDEDLLRGYVRPDRVIKRIDLDSSNIINRKKAVKTNSVDTKNGHTYTERGVTGNECKNPINEKNRDHQDDNSVSVPLSAKTGLAALYSSSIRSGPGNLPYNLSSRIPHYSRGKKIVQNDKSKNLSETIASAWAGLNDNEKTTKQAEPLKQKSKKASFVDRKYGTIDIKHSKSTHPEINDNPAKQFFVLAKRCLSSGDFARVRKLLVSMKSFGDVKNSASYLKAAQALVRTLLEYDHGTNEASNRNDSSQNGYMLIELLYPLLPSSYLVDIEIFTCKSRFDSSIFKRNCMNLLPPAEFEILCNSFFQLMLDEDRTASSRGKNQIQCKNTKKSYLQKIQPLIKKLLKYDNDGRHELLSSMLPLIPICFVDPVLSLVNEIRATEGVKKLKESEDKQQGESNVNTVLFHKSEHDGLVRIIVADDDKEEAMELKSDDITSMQESLKVAKCIKRGQSQNVQNSLEKHSEDFRKVDHYNRKSSNIDMVTKESLTMTPRPSKRAKSILNGTTANNNTLCAPSAGETLSKSDNQKALEALDPLDNFLRQAKAESYIQCTPQGVKVNRKIKANVPKELICLICDTLPKKPVMGDCGHTACFDCWTQWLTRSNTCPVCRKTTTKDSLSRLVFEEVAGSGAPSLTQICANDDDSSNSDNELEII